jgi:hypothetical protein
VLLLYRGLDFSFSFVVVVVVVVVFLSGIRN